MALITVSPENTTLGFIGTGVMGRSMAGHLLEAGYRLIVHNRTKSKADDLCANGAEWADTPAAVASGADVVFTIVGYPQDVESTYFGDTGLIGAAQDGAILVDMTTSRPDLAERIAQVCGEKGLHALDAPVSGGDVGAREARLSIMAGGEKEAFDAVAPLFQIMGKTVVLQGPAGAGQHTKLCNQIAVAATMLSVCESLIYAQGAGLDPETVLQSISGGAAGSWSLSNLGPRMIQGNFDPGFYVKHFVKDLRIAVESAEELKLDLPGLQLAKKLYEKFEADGGGDYGTHGLYKAYLEKSH